MHSSVLRVGFQRALKLRDGGIEIGLLQIRRAQVHTIAAVIWMQS